MKKLGDYLALRYTIVLQRDEEGDFIARVDELPGCAADGETSQEALDRLEEVKEQWIADCLERGDVVPEPRLDDALPSGKWVQRVPRTLHRKLVQLAEREKVSLNQLVTSVLAEAAGARQAVKHEPDVVSDAMRAWGALYSKGDVVFVKGDRHYAVSPNPDDYSRWMHRKIVHRHRQGFSTIAAVLSGRLPNDVTIRKAKYGQEEKNNIHQHD